MVVLAVVSSLLGLHVTPGAAQTKNAGGIAKATGCLQKGDEANEFSITGEDGKTYDLRSSAVGSSSIWSTK